jgi:type I restriction enzyme S subunit
VPSRSEEFTYIDISSVDRLTKRITTPQRLRGDKAPSRARKVVRTGDVLVSMTRPNLNAVALVPPELDGQIASTGFDVLRPAVIEPRFLFGVVRSDGFVEAMSDLVQGALYPAVRSRDVRAYVTSLAPLSEQRRIADKLDAVLARVDACRERLGRVPAILKKFREAVLDAAVSGRLTEDGGRAESGSDASDDLPSGWQVVAFAELIESIRTGTTAVPKDSPTEYPVLRSSSVRPLVVDLDDKRFLTRPQSDNEANFLASGDLLFTRLSGSKEFVGNCAMVHSVPPRSMQYPDRLFRARLKEPRSGEFVELAFSSARVRRQIEAKVKSSAGHQRISTDAITEAVLPMPPLAVQHEIVRRVADLFALADGVERKYGEAVPRVERITPAVLAKAFRGELVPQDPEDEPASVLLERIRMQRAAEDRSGLAGPGPGRGASVAGRGRAAAKIVAVAKKRGRRSRASSA